MKTYFYNATYNLGSPEGKYKYCWGVVSIEEDDMNDLINFFTRHCDDGYEMYNFNLTAFNPV
jgi:hypothetical protein